MQPAEHPRPLYHNPPWLISLRPLRHTVKPCGPGHIHSCQASIIPTVSHCCAFSAAIAAGLRCKVPSSSSWCCGPMARRLPHPKCWMMHLPGACICVVAAIATQASATLTWAFDLKRCAAGPCHDSDGICEQLQLKWGLVASLQAGVLQCNSLG